MSPAREYYLPGRKLVSQSDSAQIERANIPRSRFSNSWTRKTTFDAGQLIPILVDEVLPGDSMRYRATLFMRMMTMLFPVFDELRIDTFFFFVPCRLLWSNWQQFMGENLDSLLPQPISGPNVLTLPQVEVPAASGGALGTIFDYFALPLDADIDAASGAWYVNALPFRAYNLIYNEWFRDQNLSLKQPVNLDDGPDDWNDYPIVRRAKAHDYFTTCLPWPQKQLSGASVSLSGLAPVTGIGSFTGLSTAGPRAVLETPDVGASAGLAESYPNYIISSASNDISILMQPNTGATDYPLIYADLARASGGVLIQEIREAFLVQQLLEHDARSGTRYTEIILNHFGVRSPDMRLQRPEYIGGGQTPLNVTPIAQTAPTDDSVVGALGAAGTATGGHVASYAATEHGYIIGLANVRSELSYQTGIWKMWSRQTRFDFYWPNLAGLGEQAVLQRELNFTGTQGVPPDEVFGYQERWHEYRTRVSEVTGKFRSTQTGSMDAWHLAQEFSVANPGYPVLNEAFIWDVPPVPRVLAAGETATFHNFFGSILFERTAVRPIPMFGTPVMLGRF